MKKIITSLMIILMVVGAMTACSQNNSDNNNDGKKLSIVCTIFPEYDWVKQILGDHLENTDLTMLLDNGVDLHSYQPTTDDIVKISNCDMFIYVGGESDSWVEDALKEATNKNMVVINLLDFLGDTVKEEEVIQGMEGEHAEGEHAEEEDPKYDEHVWLSLKNASTLTSFISEKLGEIDEKNAADYKANGTSYIKQLDSLDKNYQKTIKEGKHKTLLFGDRFPFRYLVDDYGLSYYAAFVGCSAETEASFKTIAFLAKKVDNLGLNSIMTIEGTDHKIAQTIKENTATKDQKILSLDSMQSTTSKDVAAGATYLSIMTDNLKTLKEALK